MTMMMTCRDYIFRLTSDQLDDAGLTVQAQARLHRLMCQRCRRFTRNDEQLKAALEAQRLRLLDALKPPQD